MSTYCVVFCIIISCLLQFDSFIQCEMAEQVGGKWIKLVSLVKPSTILLPGGSSETLQRAVELQPLARTATISPAMCSAEILLQKDFSLTVSCHTQRGVEPTTSGEPSTPSELFSDTAALWR